MGFQRFHETWQEQLQNLVNKLENAPSPPTTDEENNQLYHLVQKFMSHVGDYNLVKSAVAQQDVPLVMAAPWATAFERSLHWIGGWRPTTAFHIIHTKSTVLVESRIDNMINGGGTCMTGGLSDLSADQFTDLSHLQCQTVHEEIGLSDQLSLWQDSASEILLMKYEEADFEEKMKDLAVILQKADELRLKTLREVVQLLTPQQAVEFLISAFNLYSTVCDLGFNHERQHCAN
ncbi:protein DOG1-like 1 [Apium graveolens]|uniref:protein DOG1-like 1 n=1 Tax=Apium graveolens TaxID=4045 RepID=UPI003D797D85